MVLKVIINFKGVLEKHVISKPLALNSIKL
jgi:hypothetical protein